MNDQDLQTIRGYVLALPRTKGREDANRVAVVTDGGIEYHILHKGSGAGLAAHISAHAEVTGTVSPLSSGTGTADDAEPAEKSFLLTVRSYRLTDGYDDPWYDDTIE